jgi:restriction system protein
VLVLLGNSWDQATEPIRQAKKQAALARCKPIIESHAPELLRKRRQFLVDRGYGIKSTKRWEEEKTFFVQNVLVRQESTAVSEIGTTNLSTYIESILNGHKNTTPPAPKDNSPVAYEQYCGNLLIKAGWQVSSTPYTGDQGADLIAKKYGRTVVIQCKQYSRPVGNKAIQEVNAAKLHYGADAAVVVSNMTYTRSARELAGTTTVLLLHHDQLPEL